MSDKIVTTKVGIFTLKNPEKLSRILDGQTNAKGEIVEGLGEDALTEQPDLVIALYDKLGGYITGKQGAKVKTGSFYHFKKRKAREVPEITYVYRVNGEVIEMKAGEEKPLEVQAAELAEEVKKKKAGRPKKENTE